MTIEHVKPITKKQFLFLRHHVGYWLQHQNYPTCHIAAKELGFSSANAVVDFRRTLNKKGFIDFLHDQKGLKVNFKKYAEAKAQYGRGELK